MTVGTKRSLLSAVPTWLLRHQRLRNLVPPRTKAAVAENRVRLARVTRRSDLRNVYHCCVHKTGSQWVRKVFADPDVYRVTGLRTFAYQPRQPADDRNRAYPHITFDRPFPPRRIVSPLYIGREAFASMPKPRPWRAFVVVRDPRDIVVSWYFSTISSHPTNSDRGMQHARAMLRERSEEEGLLISIERLSAYGLFDALGSWSDVTDPDVAVVRFEDLIGQDGGAWERIFEHCAIELSDDDRSKLLQRYSFRSLTGREQGQEDAGSKLRKGVAGDWRNRFTPHVAEMFERQTNALVQRLGYD